MSGDPHRYGLGEMGAGKVGCGAWGHGLVGDIGSRVMVGPDDLGGLFQP